MKMKKTLLTKTLWALLACMPTLQAQADYPLFWQRYTADPWGIEHGGRLYLFCSHDTYDPARGYGYFMNDITCISADDLLAGTLKVPSTGSTAQWQTCETSVSMYPGLYDIYFVFRGNRKASMLMDRWTFK